MGRDGNRMTAAVYYARDDIRVETVPKPRIEQDEILVQMRACGICGSDLMEWYCSQRAPLVLGHEPSGIVIDAGHEIQEVQVGDRVFVHHHVACLTCHSCRQGDFTMCDQFQQTHIQPGGFAQYFKVPAPNVHLDTLKLSDAISFEEATLIEPIACCIRALTKCRIHPKDRIAIIGAGPAGIIHTMLARNYGANQIIVSDFVEYRRNAAKRGGANIAIDPRKENVAMKVQEITDGMGADIVVVTAPNVQAILDGIESCRKGGTLCLFAPTPPDTLMQLSPHRLFFSEIQIIPSYSTSHLETRTALELISQQKVNTKELITHRFPLTQTQEAVALATKGENCLKVVIVND